MEVAAAPGRAVVVVTHGPTIAACTNRVLVLTDGRIADRRDEVGDAESLAARCLPALDATTTP